MVICLQGFRQFFIPDPFGYGVSDAKYWANQSWLKTVYTGSIPFIFVLFFAREYKVRVAPFLIATLFSIVLQWAAIRLCTTIFIPTSRSSTRSDTRSSFFFITFLFVSIAVGLGFDAFVKGIDDKKDGRPYMPCASCPVRNRRLFPWRARLLRVMGMGSAQRVGVEYPAYNHIHINIFNTKRALAFSSLRP